MWVSEEDGNDFIDKLPGLLRNYEEWNVFNAD